MVRFYLIFLLAGASLWVGCNEHPITPLERVLTAVNLPENTLPAKTKIDFLFVIDDSGSMCEEQANLSRNFSAFSDFLFVELGQSTDYRIAVTSTDILEEQGGNGRFLTGPTRDTSSTCNEAMETEEERVAQAERCRQLGTWAN